MCSFACLESRSQAATNKSGSVTNKLTPQQNLLGHLDIFFNVHLKCLKAIPGRPRPSTLAKLSKQAGFPRSRLEHTTRLELSNRLARFGCIQPWYLQYAKMIKQAKMMQNVQEIGISLLTIRPPSRQSCLATSVALA